MRGKRVTDHNHTGADHSTVDDHDGQIVSEHTHVPSRPAETRPRMKPAAERSTLVGEDASTVNAVQVSMERSGAEHIEAQRVTLDHSGAKTLSSQTAELIDSGAVKLSATTATLSNSSVWLAQTRDMQIDNSKVLVAQSGKTSIVGNGRIGILQTGSVDASGDVTAVLLMTGSVKAGGDVNVTFDAVSAGVLGAVFAGVFFLLRQLVGRSVK